MRRTQTIIRFLARNIILFALVILISTGGYLIYQLLNKSEETTEREFKTVENIDDLEKIAPVPLPNDSVILTDLGDIMIKDTIKYQIMYHAQDESFVVTIVSNPINKNQEEAEFELLKALNIDEATACKLNTIVRIAKFVNEEKSGQDYLLSFCE